jgi:hypothetical protein
MKRSIYLTAGLVLLLSTNQFCSSPPAEQSAVAIDEAAETSVLAEKVEELFNRSNQDSTVSDFIQVSLEPENLDVKLPAIQSPVFATYGSQWVLFGGRKSGLHSMNNDPPAFQNLMVNDSIWVIDLNSQTSTGIPVPIPYFRYLTASSMLHYQEGETLYTCGGFTNNGTGSVSNWTSDYFFEINIPNLIQYVLSAGSAPTLDQIFTKVISDPFLQVTGGEMIVSADNFYLIGGQNYDTSYIPGNTGKYTCAVRKFNLVQQGDAWAITNTSTIIDSTNLQRRDFTLAEVITADPDSLAAVIYGGVFTKSGLGFRSPVYINALSSGKPQITIDDTTLQKVNLYSAAHVDAVLDFGEYRINRVSILGGITYMAYDQDSAKLVVPKLGYELPFSNLISTYYTNGEDESIELVQTPPQATMPGYLGSNAVFFPLNALRYGSSNTVIDLNKVFPDNVTGPVLVGYMYGGIESPVPNTMTPNDSYNTTTNATLYGVYMTLNIPGS